VKSVVAAADLVAVVEEGEETVLVVVVPEVVAGVAGTNADLGRRRQSIE